MILLTGMSGFLGRHILNELPKAISLGRSNSNALNVDLSTTIPVDLPSFDLVIHAAGKAHSIPKTDGEKKEFYDVNVIGTKNLLKGLETSSLPKQFVYISSVAVYGLESGNKINENFALEATDPYGLSKIESERVIMKWCHANNVICTILRLPLLVGQNAPGNLGAMIKAIKKGYYFNIAKGTARKSMVLARDVASFIPVIAPVGGIYNLTDGMHPSFYELSNAISKKENHNIPLCLAILVGKLGDLIGEKAPITSLKVKKITTDLTFDDSKARQLLKWSPEPILDYLKKEIL